MVPLIRFTALGSLILLLSCLGCQTAPSQPLGNILAPPSTIPPPGTNSYTFNDAPPQVPNNPVPPTNPGGTSPFDPINPSKGETGTAVRPFESNLRAEAAPKTESSQWTASSNETQVESAGSVAKVAARTGDEIMIPVSAFRTGTGMYTDETHASRSTGTGSVTQTTYVSPFQGNKGEADQVKSQPAPAYAEKVEVE